jgi:hypothetical protein
MDLVDVLIDASVESSGQSFLTILGTPALETYYLDLHERYLPDSSGQKMVRVASHFAIQQLATRSYLQPATERVLQIGALDACDLAAGLLDVVPHTRVTWVPGFSDVTAAQTADVVERARVLLPPDGLPLQLAITSDDWRTVAANAEPDSHGLIAVFSDRNIRDMAACVTDLRRLLNPRGRLLLFEALSGGRRPTEIEGVDFVGRYFMSGSGPVRTLAITVVPAPTREQAA